MQQFQVISLYRTGLISRACWPCSLIVRSGYWRTSSCSSQVVVDLWRSVTTANQGLRVEDKRQQSLIMMFFSWHRSVEPDVKPEWGTFRTRHISVIDQTWWRALMKRHFIWALLQSTAPPFSVYPACPQFAWAALSVGVSPSRPAAYPMPGTR